MSGKEKQEGGLSWNIISLLDKYSMSGKEKQGVREGTAISTQGLRQPICPLCIAGLDFGPYLSFGQVSWALSNLHNRMCHPHT